MHNATWIAAAAVAAVSATSAIAAAQSNPTFSYGTRDDVKEVEWAAAAEGGLVHTTGNARTTTATGSVKASRKDGDNKFEGEASGALARARNRVGQDLDENGTIDSEAEITDETITSAKNAFLKLRYDRFLTDNNSLYASATIGFDEPAGKELVGGGQIGYSRLVYKDDRHELKAEVGYDFTYEKQATVSDDLSIHSARFFVGYKGALQTKTDDEGKEQALTTLDASLESLHNINSLDVPTGDGEAGAFEDTRVNGQVAVSTKLWDDLSIAVSFGAKFDNVPAPAAELAAAPYAAGFVPEAEKLDTITKASLIYSFL
jgi:hypothetical protein